MHKRLHLGFFWGCLEEEEGFLQEAARIRTFQELNPDLGDSESLNALTSTEVLGALCIGSEWA